MYSIETMYAMYNHGNDIFMYTVGQKFSDF